LDALEGACRFLYPLLAVFLGSLDGRVAILETSNAAILRNVRIMPTMSYIFITEPYISSYADIDVLLAIWRSGALHYYSWSGWREQRPAMGYCDCLA
jgi:hypothetical protein